MRVVWCGVRGCGITLLVAGIVWSPGWLGGVSHNLPLLATLELWWLSCRIVASQRSSPVKVWKCFLNHTSSFIAPNCLVFLALGNRTVSRCAPELRSVYISKEQAHGVSTLFANLAAVASAQSLYFLCLCHLPPHQASVFPVRGVYLRQKQF